MSRAKLKVAKKGVFVLLVDRIRPGQNDFAPGGFYQNGGFHGAVNLIISVC